jgi:hypothetical protein
VALSEEDLTIKAPATSRVPFTNIWRESGANRLAPAAGAGTMSATLGALGATGPRSTDAASLVEMLEGRDPEHEVVAQVHAKAPRVSAGMMVGIGVVLILLVATVGYLAFLLYGG